jgi:hypothetical protein
VSDLREKIKAIGRFGRAVWKSLAGVPSSLREWWKKVALAARRIARWATLVLMIALVAAALYLKDLREPVTGSVRAGSLTPGSSVELTDVTSQPRVEAVLGDLVIEVKEGVESPDEIAGPGFLVELPMRFGDCRRLATQIGGGCSGATNRLRDFESFRVRALRSNRLVRVGIRMEGLRTLSLGHGARAVEQEVPSGWTLEAAGGLAVLSLECDRTTPLVVTVLASRSDKRPIRCVGSADTYRLRIPDPERFPVPVFVNDVDLFTIEGAKAQEARLSAEEGTAWVERSEISLSPGPKGVEVLAADGRRLGFGFESGRGQQREWVSVRAGAAKSFQVSGVEEVPTWFERHEVLALIILSVLLASAPLFWKALRGG